jgi:glucose/arabinose dehydrogenase
MVPGFLACGVFVALTSAVASTAQQAALAGLAPQQAPAARGRGPAPADTPGAGPWDLGAGRGPTHVEVVTKGLDHPWGRGLLDVALHPRFAENPDGFLYVLTDETFGAILRMEPPRQQPRSQPMRHRHLP